MYGVTLPTDISTALNGLLGELPQKMIVEKFNNHMGYDKHNHTIKKDN